MNAAAQPDYSIIVPAYNESQRIRACMQSILATLDAEHWDAEVIVVNATTREPSSSNSRRRIRASASSVIK